MATIKEAYFNDRMGPLLLLGLGSGLAYALCNDTLQAWLTDQKVSLEMLGVASFIALPFSLKFLWAPLMDRYVPPLLGRRRGWLLLTQLAIIALTMTMASVGAQRLWMLGAMAMGLSFVAASQDIVGDAYRTDLLAAHERGAGAAVWVMGWRGGYALSGVAALVLVGRGWVSWQTAYQLMAATMVVPIIGALLAPEPAQVSSPPQSLGETFVEPLRRFVLGGEGWLIIAFILLFKAPDFLAGQMTIPFLRRGAGFTQDQIGIIRQGLGVGVMIAGTLVGGAMTARLNLRTCLWVCAVLQGVSNLAFVPLVYSGPSVAMLAGTIGVENFVAGISNAVFVAFLTGHCETRYSATQYALLSGVMALSRTACAVPSGWLAAQTGWPLFFVLSMLTMLPGLVLTVWVPLARPETSPRGFAVETSESANSPQA